MAKSKKKRSKKQQYKPKQSIKQESKRSRKISRPLVAVCIAAILAITAVFAFDVENGKLKLAFNQSEATIISDLPDNTPRLSVDQEEIDFGTVKHNTRKFFSFTVTNTGNDVLKFDRPPKIKVEKGC